MTVFKETSPAPGPGHDLLMQVWQDQDGSLVVQIAGQHYRRVFDIRDRETGRRLLEIINRLVAFSKGRETRELAAPSASPAPEPALEARRQAFFKELTSPADDRPRLSRITADPVPFRGRSPLERPGINLNLADEIERLLQLRVDASPDFRQRAVHVRSAPDGGLRFDVDGARYTALDEIPDPQVQALLRAAISDWDARR